MILHGKVSAPIGRTGQRGDLPSDSLARRKFRNLGTVAVTHGGVGMMDAHGIFIEGSEPRSDKERRQRELFLGYCGALLNPEQMASWFAPDFWPHDLIPGDQPPPEGTGNAAMKGFRKSINSALTLRSGTGTWIEDDAELSELAGGADPGDLVGAKTTLTYVACSS